MFDVINLIFHSPSSVVLKRGRIIKRNGNKLYMIVNDDYYVYILNEDGNIDYTSSNVISFHKHKS